MMMTLIAVIIHSCIHDGFRDKWPMYAGLTNPFVLTDADEEHGNDANVSECYGNIARYSPGV